MLTRSRRTLCPAMKLSRQSARVLVLREKWLFSSVTRWLPIILTDIADFYQLTCCWLICTVGYFSWMFSYTAAVCRNLFRYVFIALLSLVFMLTVRPDFCAFGLLYFKTVFLWWSRIIFSKLVRSISLVYCIISSISAIRSKLYLDDFIFVGKSVLVF